MSDTSRSANVASAAAGARRIRYAVAATAFGQLLVATGERGLCAVSLGDTAGELEAELRRQFPHDDVRHAPDELSGWMAAVQRHLHGSGPRLDLPLELVGTEFQRLVWRALQDIPYGSTRTYTEIAAAIGRPTAVRAVARACATNRLAVLVPCHRVLRNDGTLSGYRWGIERKRMLIEQERLNLESLRSDAA